MNQVVGNVEKLRAFARAHHRPDSADAWVAERIMEFLNRRGEISLDEAFGVATRHGRRPWWLQKRLHERNACIRKLGDMFPSGTQRSRARRIICAAERYRSGRWVFDRNRDMRYDDPVTEELKRLLTATSGVVPSERVIRDALRALADTAETADDG